MAHVDLSGMNKIQRRIQEVADFAATVHAIVKDKGDYYVEFKNGTRQPAHAFQHNSTIREMIQKAITRLDQINQSRNG